MSHFTVLVITKTVDEVDEVMKPYDENDQVAPYDVLVGEPKDFWATDMLIEEGLVPAEPTAEEVIEAYRKKYDIETGEQMFARDGKLYEVSTYNPKSKWDWYQMGGRWRGFFQLRPLVTVDDPERLAAHVDSALGDPGTFEHLDIQDGKGPHANYEGKADQARKGEIDFDVMRDLAGHEAEATFDKFLEATKGVPVSRTWPEILNETLTNAGLPTEWDGPEGYLETHRPKFNPLVVPRDLSEEELLDPELFTEENRTNVLVDRDDKAWREPWDNAMAEARKTFHDQPFEQALRKADFYFWGESVHEKFFIGDPDARQKYVQKARDHAFTTYAVVKDGKWYQRGEMGWWGMSRNEVDDDEWRNHVNTLLDELPNDAVLTVLDCHI